MKFGINTLMLLIVYQIVSISLLHKRLENQYPDLTAKERENKICKEFGCVFVMQIGNVLQSGQKHDGRAPDYDDWKLNGDLLFWYEPLQCALEISSMGIRVDEDSLVEQLKKENCEDRLNLPYIELSSIKNYLTQLVAVLVNQDFVCCF